MKMSVRHRVLSGLFAGASVLLAGCAVPGQSVAPGAAAAYDGVTLSNERIAALATAWEDEAAEPAGRRNVITLELMREPLLDATDEIGYEYHRTMAVQQAQLALRMQGVDAEPSEDFVDAIESAFLLAAFTLIPEDTSVLQSVAEQVEAEAVLSPRSGEFNADQFMATTAAAVEVATQEANQGSPIWFVNFNNVNGLVPPESPWLATE